MLKIYSMITHNGISYEYTEFAGYACVHIDGHLTYWGKRKDVLLALVELPLLAVLKLSVHFVLT